MKRFARFALLAGIATLFSAQAPASVTRSNDDPSVNIVVTVKTTHWVYNWWYNAVVIDSTESNTYVLHAGESIDIQDSGDEQDYLTYEVDSESSEPNPDYSP